MTIHEAEWGNTIDKAAKDAVKAECTKLIHNDKLYEVVVTTTLIGRIQRPMEAEPMDEQERTPVARENPDNIF